MLNQYLVYLTIARLLQAKMKRDDTIVNEGKVGLQHDVRNEIVFYFALITIFISHFDIFLSYDIYEKDREWKIQRRAKCSGYCANNSTSVNIFLC